MKSGRLLPKEITKSGYGPLCVEELGRSWPLSTETGAKKRVENSGNGYPRTIKMSILSVIYGKPTTKSFPKKPIVRWEKKRGIPHIWNDGTIHSGRGTHGSLEKPFHFQKDFWWHDKALHSFILSYNSQCHLI